MIICLARILHRSALAVALVAALVGFSRSASALLIQPGDVAKLSYDFSSVLPAGATPSELGLQLAASLWLQNTSFATQFFNSDGTAISSSSTLTNTFGFDAANPAFSTLVSGSVNPSGFVLFTDLDIPNFGITEALVSPLVGGTFLGPVNASISSVSATPLPSTWGMMLTGLGLVAYLAYRRRESGGVLAAA